MHTYARGRFRLRSRTGLRMSVRAESGVLNMRSLFPEEFADLEAVGAPWSIGSDNERSRTRAGSSMEDMEVFYDAVLPRAHEILAYCDRFDVRNPPEEMRVLMSMLYSLIVVSSAVEAWKRARVSDSATRPAAAAG